MKNHSALKETWGKCMQKGIQKQPRKTELAIGLYLQSYPSVLFSMLSSSSLNIYVYGLNL